MPDKAIIPVRRSPLLDRSPIKGKVELAERRGLGKVILRGLPDDPAFVEAATAVLGVALPLQPNSTAAKPDGGRIYWLGPNEWIIHTLSDSTELTRNLDTALADCYFQVVDVSDQYTIIRLAGPRARTILAKACPLDLHPTVFAVGTVAQSHYAKAPIMLYLANGEPVFDLQVRWSYADYLWNYLLAAADPIGDDVVEPVV